MSDTLCNEKKKSYTFSEDGNSCIITDTRTPRYWYNYRVCSIWYILRVFMKIITVRRFPRQDMGAAITSVKKQICV